MNIIRQKEEEKTSRAATQEMSFLDHLEELRRTLVRMGAVTLVSMLACFFFTPTLMNFLRLPAQRVWIEHEQSHLPAQVDAQDWVDAKKYAQLRAVLPTDAAAALEQRVPVNIRNLADAVVLLRAAELLPSDERETFLQQASGSEELHSLCRSLRSHDADLQSEAEGQASSRIMGAFRPGEAFMLSVQLAFFGGVIVASPALLYLLLSFVTPGLLEKERRVVRRSLWWGIALFVLGCSFAYFAVLPRVLTFFFEYSLDMGISNDWRIGYYLTFAVKLILVFGIIFELPVVLIPLMKLGILTRGLMKRIRPYIFVGSFVVALVLAPAPDPGTMLLMALPLYLLYELCLLFAREGPRAHPSQEKRDQNKHLSVGDAT